MIETLPRITTEAELRALIGGSPTAVVAEKIVDDRIAPPCLGDPAQHVDRSALPSSGGILRWIKQGDFDPERHDGERAARDARGDGLY